VSPETLVNRTPNHRRVAKKAVFDAASARKTFSPQMDLFKESINTPLHWLMDSVAVGVAVATCKGDLLYANCRFLEMLGQPLLADSRLPNLKSLIAVSSWPPLEQAMSQGAVEPTEGQIDVLGPDRGLRTLRISFSPFALVPSAVGIVATEVTGLVKAENALKRSQDSMISLSARVLEVQDEERRRLARDLHDTVGQEIVVALMTLDTIARTWDKPDPTARKNLLEAIDWLRKVESEIRTFSYLLHPPLLDDMGLGSALSWYIEGFSKRSGILVQLSLPENLPRLPLQAETALFRITQESLSNVIRHSRSDKAWVVVTLEPDSLTLSIRDEGRGFDTAAHAGSAPPGVGIEGMRGRLKSLGGILSLQSGPRGTEVLASVPLNGGQKVAAGGVHEQRHRVPGITRAASSAKRILIVDDHEVARKGIRFLLNEETDLEICGEAQNGAEAFEKTQELIPDLIILDLNMPGGGGFSAANRIRNAGLSPKILIYTTHTFRGLERMARAADCDGFVVKSNATKDLIRGIRAVLRGEEFYSSLDSAAQGA
jgi:signal transduction histidine kinase/AmiR/NasT family two-component response regulator